MKGSCVLIFVLLHIRGSQVSYKGGKRWRVAPFQRTLSISFLSLICLTPLAK